MIRRKNALPCFVATSTYRHLLYPIDDFKPASVDKQKMGTVEVEGNHQVTVTVPHVEGSGTNQTVFKGNHKPVAKECILIIDHVTGEIVLERISQAISVKTTRYVVTYAKF